MSTPYETDEHVIDEWTLNYLPSEGGRYTGKLAITNKNIYFFAQFSIEFSGNAVQDAEGGIRISKEYIHASNGDSWIDRDGFKMLLPHVCDQVIQ